jgi:hypothetical protein
VAVHGPRLAAAIIEAAEEVGDLARGDLGDPTITERRD